MDRPAATHPPIAFGPIRSRRLGWSLGINNVPPKSCSYGCVYCQVGATDRPSIRRSMVFAPDELVAAVLARVEECGRAASPIDYATFVPNGEPTLDLGLGAAVRGLQDAGLAVAVISNGSLLWDESVREALQAADLVSIKVDTVDEPTWRRLNRPVDHLALPVVLEGMRRFAACYRGTLLTETMVVADINDDPLAAARTARFVGALEPLRAYVTVPTRPPTEGWVRAPSDEEALGVAAAFRAAEVPTTCLLADSEDPFVPGGDARRDLLGIVAVHPVTEADARTYLARSGADLSIVGDLVDDGCVEVVSFNGARYLRATRSRPGVGDTPRRQGMRGGRTPGDDVRAGEAGLARSDGGCSPVPTAANTQEVAR